MKLSQYAKQQRIGSRTALRWWKAGQLPGYQTSTGTVIVADPTSTAARRYGQRRAKRQTEVLVKQLETPPSPRLQRLWRRRSPL